MKLFSVAFAQGEISGRRIDKLPDGLAEMKPDGGTTFIIGHSETGHHHTMVMERTRVFEAKPAPPGMKILYAILDAPNELIHERPFDTHETIGFQPGMYEFRIGREFDPYAEMARQQAD